MFSNHRFSRWAFFFTFFGSVVLATAASALTFDEVRAALERDPAATWKAADNDKAEELQIANREVPFGLPNNPDQGQSAFEVVRDGQEVGRDIPTYLDWRNKDGKNWLSPIKNQGACGSCVAFASMGVFEGQINVTSGRPDLNLDLSEQYLFAAIGKCDSGAWPDEAFSSLESRGTPDETCLPYTSGRTAEDVDSSQACADVKKRAYKLANADSLNSASSIKTALQNGPVSTTMTVYEDFMFYSEGVYQHVTGSAVGGHAVVIVGYDDANDAWIVRNSWGADWGEKGYFRIKRNDDSDLGQSGHKLTVNKVSKLVKLLEPVYFGAVSQAAVLKIENKADAKLKDAKFEIVNMKDASQKITGAIDVTSMQASVSVGHVTDGVYQVMIAGTFADGSTVEKPWYSTMFIANKAPEIQVKLNPEFDVNTPISGKVYTKIEVRYGAIPLSDVVLIFKQKNGSYERKARIESPGDGLKVSWRSNTAPNGDYEIYAIGNVGTLYQFESQRLSVKVKN